MEKVTDTFLDATGTTLEIMKKNVISVIKSKTNKPYTIDKKKVLKDFIKLNHGCIDEFVTNYSFGFFMCNPAIDSPINREAMYIELKEFLSKLTSKRQLYSNTYKSA